MHNTHTQERVTEQHENTIYRVRVRSDEETARLERLVKELDNRQMFDYQTGTRILRDLENEEGKVVGTVKNKSWEPIKRKVQAHSSVEAAALVDSHSG